jgi:hypothetical protein
MSRPPKVCIADTCKHRHDCTVYRSFSDLKKCSRQLIIDPYVGVVCFEREKVKKCDHIVCLDVDYNEGHGDVTDAFFELVSQSNSTSLGGYGTTEFKFCPMCGVALKEFHYKFLNDESGTVFTKRVGLDYVPAKNEVPTKQEEKEKVK